MESMDELEQPLLDNNPQEKESSIGCIYGKGLFKGVLVRCEEEKTLPPVPWSSYCSPAELHRQQLLNAHSLPSNVEAIYPRALAWGIRSKGFHGKDCLETTFVDISPGSTLDGRVVGVSRDSHGVGYHSDEEEPLAHYEGSSSEDLSDSESESSFSLMIPQDYLGLAVFSMLCCFWPLGIAAFYLSQKTNKASAQGDFRKASSASRQALWLSVLSIVFGVITYICAVAALVAYLSGRSR